MFDIVLPQNNEIELIKMAEMLGWTELCLVYKSPKDLSSFKEKTGIKLLLGILAEPGSEQKFVGKADVLLSKSFDASTVRTLCECGFVHMIFGLEQSPRPDFMHHRNSGLNHISAKLMDEKNISLCIDFSSILSSEGKEGSKILGRMKQNLVFARKYDLEVVVASFAVSPYDMRPPESLRAVLKV